MSHDIRVLTESADLVRSSTVFYTALVAFGPPELDDDPDRFYEPGRVIGSYDDGEMVGTAMSMTSRLVVPGGAGIAHAMVTDIGVLPSHKRRGHASALVGHQLRDFARRGEAVATLRASEATIYERFGYGVATSVATVEVDRTRGGLRDTVPDGGRVRFADPRTSFDLQARVYTPTRTGALERPSYWWRAHEWISGRDKSRVGYLVVHGEPGAEDGYCSYRPLDPDNWFDQPNPTVAVYDMVARTPSAYYGLLRFLLGLDLVRTIRFNAIPVDNGLTLMTKDPRAARTTQVRDETWLRLVDVETALTARTYGETSGEDGAVVLEVHDGLLPENSGRYRIGPDGVKRTDAVADLSLDVSALATAYLGGTRLRALADAGRVGVHSPRALAVADRLFATEAAPYCGTWF